MTTDLTGRRVRVHVNLHRGDLTIADPSTGRVIVNVDDVTLTDVTFRHQPACVDRVVTRKRRKVCAYAIGVVAAVNTAEPATGRRVRYNPFVRPDFHDADTGEHIDTAPRVLFTERRAYITH